MLGESLSDLRHAGIIPADTPRPSYVSVKEAVLPFNRFPTVDTLLGPEMRSTGEVMGIGETFGIAFAKAQLAAGTALPKEGRVFLSLADRDKLAGLAVAQSLVGLGFEIVATTGTAEYLQQAGLEVSRVVKKFGTIEPGDSAVELIADGFINLVINTPSGSNAYADGAAIRRASTVHGVPCLTTVAAAQAAVLGIRETTQQGWRVMSLQELHQ
jgi:carbamoyl-phosphate synthase large subunit